MKHLLLAGCALAAPLALAAQGRVTLDSATLAGFRWRPIGPANMAGRITDVEGIASPSKTFYFAAATGGVWKTTNGGVTFRPLFDHERVASLGDLAIAPSDTNIVWLGTGEEDSRNSISPGGGIYKSTDGGASWKHMGLTETHTIGRIVIHPRDPNIVYVAALGHIWGPNRDRGLYKTTDGGATWQLVKFISDRAGFVDIAMDPSNPDVLFASSWERQRGPYFLRSGGPGSALWKTTDAGKTWAEVKGGGLPETPKGRISVAIAASNPKVMYLMVEADTTPNASKEKKPAQTRPSGLYRSSDGGATWERTNSNNVRPFYYSQVRVDPKNPDRVYWSSTPVNYSNDGGKTVGNATVGIHVDHHAMWIDPNDPDHIIVGNDGGIAITWDKGGSWDFPNVLPLGQFYNISYGMEHPYSVCGGLQDNGSWCAPSRRRQGDLTNADWTNVGGGDGFHTAQDPYDPGIIYVESQGGNMSRLDFRTGERTPLVKPNWRPRYRQYEDSIVIERPDTTRPATAEQQRRIADLRRRAAADSMELDLRWNWNTPFFISAHNPSTFYTGANRVLKSTKRGEDMYPISPDLSTRDTMRIRISMRATGGITPDITGAETHSTIVSLAESPVRPGILYAGTDDGNTWLSRNDGGTWENLTSRFPGVPPKTYVSRIEPSRFDSATVYVTFDGHRNDDFTPYVFVSTDFGKTFRSIVNNLPKGGPDFVHVVREDPINRNLLYVGTDVGAYISLDRGANWQKFMTNLPTVPVHDLKIHPRERELIAGTHGRSIWIVDVAPLQQLGDSVLTTTAHFFQPKTAYQYGQSPLGGGSSGHKLFRAASPPYGAELVYRLAQGAGDRRARTNILITDVRGDTVRTLTGPATAGMHRVAWDFRGRQAAPATLSPSQKRDSSLLVRRVAVVFDSLAAAGGNKQMLDPIRAAILAGDVQTLAQRLGVGGGGGGGGGGGQNTVRAGAPFVDRPGETPARAPGAAAQAAAGQPQEGGDSGPMPEPGFAGQLGSLLRAGVPGAAPGGGGGGGGAGGLAFIGQIFGRAPAGGGGGGFGGGGGGPLMPSGDYLVTITGGGKTMKRVLRVEAVGGMNGTSAAGSDQQD